MRDASDVFPDDLRVLLEAQGRADRDAAWTRLISRHNLLLLHVTNSVTRRREDSMDAYAMVLEELRVDDFRRLRAYEADGRSKFTTWLVIVVQRLCFDFVRRQYGRHREDAANGNGPSLAAVSRRHLRDLLSGTVDLASIADEHGKDLDARIREQELQAHLEHALGELAAEDRLIIKLRFEDGLTAREIARLIGMSTQFHVYRRLSAITDGLRQRLAERGVDGSAP
jgi:RNA polymerase sigma factor (sigma-70 family)